MNVFKNETLKVSVNYEESGLEKGGEGYIIHYKIYNVSEKKLQLNIKETGLYYSNTIRERDYYLTGYLLSEFELPSNTYREGADIFLKSNAKFNVNDKFYIKIEDSTNAEEYTLFFEKVNSTNKNLKCISSEINENLSLNPKLLENKLQYSIERLDALEEKIGFTIENLSVKLDDYMIVVLGDFFMSDFEEYSDIRLNTTYYDKDNNIISTDHCTIYLSDFLGFESFEIRQFFHEPSEVDRIRLYPSVTKR